jgi:ABC-type bacteriocin/lantibiotic exporter with double-glycine peptidase domain
MRAVDLANSRALSLGTLLWICFAQVLLLIAFLLVKSTHTYCLERIRWRVTLRLQRRLFAHLLHLPLTYHQSVPPGYLAQRVQEDANQVQSIIGGSLVSILSDLASLAVGVFALVHLHPRLAFLSMLSLPPLAWLFVHVRSDLRDDIRLSQEASGQLQSYLTEYLTRIACVKASVLEHGVARGFVRSVNLLIRRQRTVLSRRLRYELIVGSLAGAAPIVVLGYGAAEIAAGRLTVGQFAAFNAFLLYLSRPAENVVISLLGAQAAVSSADRVEQILDHEKEPDVGAECPQPVHRSRLGLEFRSVSARYAQDRPPVLTRVSLRLFAGDVAVVVGPSGAGKSTLVKMVPRLVLPISGTVFVSGLSVMRVPLASLRRFAAIVQTDPVVFPATIRENIAGWSAGAGLSCEDSA